MLYYFWLGEEGESLCDWEQEYYESLMYEEEQRERDRREYDRLYEEEYGIY